MSKENGLLDFVAELHLIDGVITDWLSPIPTFNGDDMNKIGSETLKKQFGEGDISVALMRNEKDAFEAIRLDRWYDNTETHLMKTDVMQKIRKHN